MLPSSRIWPALVLILITTSAHAAPPTWTRITPRGAERAKPTEIVITGTNLTAKSRLILPFPGTASLLPDAKPNPNQVRFQLTVNQSVPLGFYPLRVVTEDGISPVFFFCVDALPHINEVEDNSSFAKAQKVSVPVIVNGECAGGDVDFFRFPAKKGQQLMIEAEAARLGSGILPQLRLTDDRQRFLAADDSQSLAGDCRIHFVAPADGDYVVEISDTRYKGTAPAFYRLRIAEYDVAADVFPLGGKRGETVSFTLRGGSLKGEVRVQRKLDDSWAAGRMLLSLEGVGKAGALPTWVAVSDLPERIWIKDAGKASTLDVQPPLVVNGRLEQPDAVDRVQFPVQPGQKYRIAVEAENLGSSLDGVLRITDQLGKQLAQVDDVDIPPLAPGQPPTKGADPALDFTVPAGTTRLVLELRDQRGRGGINFGYRLRIEPAAPDFSLRPTATGINVPRGGTAVLRVPIVRRGYSGALRLTVPNLPGGLSVQGGDVPDNAAEGVLTITSAAGAADPAEPLSLRVQGKAMIDGKEVQRWAEHKVVLSREGNPVVSTVKLAHLAAGLTSADPLRVQGPPTVEVVKGSPVQIPVTLVRDPSVAALPVEISAFVSAVSGPPVNIYTLPPATVAAGANNATLTLTPRAPAPEGKQNLILQGKVKIKNVDHIVFSQAVPLTVHAPFTVVLEPPALTLTPGQNVVLKGKVQRQPSFKDAVQFRLDGLPAGVTLVKPLTPVPGNVSDFQIELKVDPKFKTPTASFTLTTSANLAGIPYARPALTIPASLAAK